MKTLYRYTATWCQTGLDPATWTESLTWEWHKLLSRGQAQEAARNLIGDQCSRNNYPLPFTLPTVSAQRLTIEPVPLTD